MDHWRVPLKLVEGCETVEITHTKGFIQNTGTPDWTKIDVTHLPLKESFFRGGYVSKPWDLTWGSTILDNPHYIQSKISTARS